MKIETKLNVGDKIYFLSGGRIASATISLIEVKVRKGQTEIYYLWSEYDPVSERTDCRSLPERVAFTTKEALVEHLLENCKEE